QRPSPNETVARPAAWTYEAAVDVLGRSSVAADRTAAAKELRHYADRDGAWLAPASALRDPRPPRSPAAGGRQVGGVRRGSVGESAAEEVRTRCVSCMTASTIIPDSRVNAPTETMAPVIPTVSAMVPASNAPTAYPLSRHSR